MVRRLRLSFRCRRPPSRTEATAIEEVREALEIAEQYGVVDVDDRDDDDSGATAFDLSVDLVVLFAGGWAGPAGGALRWAVLRLAGLPAHELVVRLGNARASAAEAVEQ